MERLTDEERKVLYPNVFGTHEGQKVLVDILDMLKYWHGNRSKRMTGEEEATLRAIGSTIIGWCVPNVDSLEFVQRIMFLRRRHRKENTQ